LFNLVLQQGPLFTSCNRHWPPPGIDHHVIAVCKMRQTLHRYNWTCIL